MNVKESPPILPARLDWASAIGNFLLNFGALHYIIVELLHNTLSPSEFEWYREKHLQKQVLRIQQQLQDTGYPEEKQAEFARLISRLDSIRRLRNHIAPGYMTLLLDAATLEWVISLSRTKDLDREYSAETRHVSFSELRSNLDELTELIEAFRRFAKPEPA